MPFGSPSPQWKADRYAVGFAARLVPYLDPSGFWVLLDAGVPSGAFVDDPGGSGFTVIDDTLATGLKPTLLPSGMVVFY